MAFRRIETRREMLAADDVSYSGLVLDQPSVSRLLNNPEISQYIGPDWTVKAHHMTIKLGGLRGTPHEERLGQTEQINATHVGMTNEKNVLAVAVDGASDNAIPHVTIAVNEGAGGESHHSNQITNWVPLSQPIPLNGVVEERSQLQKREV